MQVFVNFPSTCIFQILKDHCDKLERKGINVSVAGAQVCGVL